jgi:hypothetical protein
LNSEAKRFYNEVKRLADVCRHRSAVADATGFGDGRDDQSHYHRAGRPEWPRR